ncbi:hypothetical protein L2E82_44512 [Cichorium intybus]|uniref:Uncharacterized protein n=1 Tax=Cichorium intybus TaxID=13427 RepID=A0ACB8ZQH6_CICIN|nr:hypothetical protein L2E82_44512 [Cichorium intybus]
MEKVKQCYPILHRERRWRMAVMTYSTCATGVLSLKRGIDAKRLFAFDFAFDRGEGDGDCGEATRNEL